MIELTEPQAKAVEAEKKPLHLMNPRTQEVFVLIRKQVYDLTCSMAGGEAKVWDDADDNDLIRKST
ncbi:MAG: hypothetical protein U0793_01115 [Gemmataceae bacterium]